MQGLPVVAPDPDDEKAQEAPSSSSRPVLPMPEPQPEQQENRGDGELLRETDGETLGVSTEAVAAKARGNLVTRPLAERQWHRLVHLPFRNWCTFCVMGRWREESHRKREKREIMAQRVWLDDTMLKTCWWCSSFEKLRSKTKDPRMLRSRSSSSARNLGI